MVMSGRQQPQDCGLEIACWCSTFLVVFLSSHHHVQNEADPSCEKQFQDAVGGVRRRQAVPGRSRMQNILRTSEHTTQSVL